MTENTFIKWIKDEAKDYERRKKAMAKKKEEKSQISDGVLKLVNITKELTRHIDECGIRYSTYDEIHKVEDAVDVVVEETNLKLQKHVCEVGEQKGELSRAWWSDFVRADDPKAFKEEENG